jgi:hypothetical protein
MLRNPVAVEKLALNEFAEIASRQQALQTIFPSALDILYRPIFDFFQKNRLFQQPLLLSQSQNATLRSDQNHSFAAHAELSKSWRLAGAS